LKERTKELSSIGNGYFFGLCANGKLRTAPSLKSFRPPFSKGGEVKGE
jgi:hypothetical protein